MSLSSDAPPFRLRARFAYPLAAVSGLCLAASYPGLGLWPLAFLGVAGILLSSIGRGFGSGFMVGAVGGLVFWGLLIHWLSLYLGPVPWVALAAVMGTYFALGVAVSAWVTSALFARFRHHSLPVLPVVIAAIWLTREVVSGVWPYGGFPWGRIALSQSDSPFAGASSWLGISGLSFVIVWLCAVPVVAIWWRLSRSEVEADAALGDGRRAVTAGFAIVVALAAACMPTWGAMTQSNASTTRVAAIQGNAHAGLFAEHARGEWLENHLAATRAADLTGVDIVVWPENSSDVDPASDANAYADIKKLVDETGVPLVFGTIQQRDSQYFNSSLLWLPGQGIAETYDKRHPVPFAEYMPDRAFFRALAPDLVDLVQRNYTAGTTNGVFTSAGSTFAVNICFDVAYDDVFRDAVFGGATFILSQTNNADFGYSVESEQQLAIAKMQAIANGRSVVSISTVGYSAIFGPDGATLASAPRFVAASLIADVPTVSDIAPGTVVNVLSELCAAVFVGGVISVLGYLRLGAALRRSRKALT